MLERERKDPEERGKRIEMEKKIENRSFGVVDRKEGVTQFLIIV